MTATRHHAEATGNALYAAVIANPFATLPRLVYADWLDENSGDEECPECRRWQSVPGTTGPFYCHPCHGTGRVPNHYAERAEFIRIEVDGGENTAAVQRASDLFDRHHGRWFWSDGKGPADGFGLTRSTSPPGGRWLYVRNGFGETVITDLAWWVGGVCDDCQGHAEDGSPDGDCRACNNTGRTPGHGPEVVSRHPVTRVVISDREPDEDWEDCFFWPFSDIGHGVLPLGLVRTDHLSHDGGGSRVSNTFPTREAAEAALSRALVDLARERAGLPPIRWEASQ